MNRRNHSKQKLRAGQRTELKAVLRKHKAEGLKVHRANAHLLLDDGHSASFVASVLFLDADTVHRWRRDFEQKGMASLDLAEYPEREDHLTAAQEAAEHFRAQPPCDTKGVRAWLRETFGIEYSHPGSIKLMHRLGFDWKWPERLPKHADPVAQKDFIGEV